MNNPKKYKIILLNMKRPLFPPKFFHNRSLGSLARLVIKIWSSPPLCITCKSNSSNLIKVEVALSLSGAGEIAYLILSLRWRQKSLAYFQGPILNYCSIMFTDCIESKHTKAWPEGLKGFIISFINFYSSLSIFSET